MPDNNDLRILISKLYRGGAQIPADQFKHWALEQLRTLIPFDAALFGTGNISRGKFHNSTVLGLPDEFVTALENISGDSFFKKMTAKSGTSMRIIDVVDNDYYFQSRVYRRCFSHYGVERILLSIHYERHTGLFTLLSLYRFDRDNDFTETEREIHEALSYHLVEAYSHVFFLHLTRPKGPSRNRFTAVADIQGVLRHAQSGFAEALEQKFHGCADGRLPFAVREGTFLPENGELRVQISPLGDLFMVEIWDDGPLEQLTVREREVVNAVCRGLSDKEIANDIGLAPPTVSSHLYHAYKKLGVSSRRSLRQLLQPGTQS